MDDLVQDLHEEDNTNPPLKDLLVHCHSHVLMSCTPSAQDDTRLLERYNQFKDANPRPRFALQLIFNQKRDHHCQVIKMDNELHEVYTCRIKLWEGIEDTVLKRLNSELKNNIKIPEKKANTSYAKKKKNKANATNLLPYTSRGQIVDTSDMVELWGEGSPIVILGELNLRNRKLFGDLIKDLCLTPTYQSRMAYNRAMTLVNSVSPAKDNPEIKIYSFNNEILGFTLIIDTIKTEVKLINILVGKIIYGW
jgi:hypothetical protein